MPRRSSNARLQNGNAAPRPSAGSHESADGPTREDIAVRAYELFLARGCAHGCHEEDWNRAEQELRKIPQPA
jgi:hypothetical protein